MMKGDNNEQNKFWKTDFYVPDAGFDNCNL